MRKPRQKCRVFYINEVKAYQMCRVAESPIGIIIPPLSLLLYGIIIAPLCIIFNFEWYTYYTRIMSNLKNFLFNIKTKESVQTTPLTYVHCMLFNFRVGGGPLGAFGWRDSGMGFILSD